MPREQTTAEIIAAENTQLRLLLREAMEDIDFDHHWRCHSPYASKPGECVCGLDDWERRVLTALQQDAPVSGGEST